VTGPKQGSWFPLLITFGLLSCIASNSFLTINEALNHTYNNWTLALFAIGMAGNIAALLAQLCATYSDPGEVTPKQDVSSDQAYRTAMDLYPEEIQEF